MYLNDLPHTVTVISVDLPFKGGGEGADIQRESEEKEAAE